MKLRQTIYAAMAGAVMLMATASCGIYKKYETPRNTALTAAYAEARADSSTYDKGAFGNLLWEDVFKDPVLADMINRALANNTSLQDARLNVGIAQAQLKGARLAYLPSLSIAPNGTGSGTTLAGTSWQWAYQLPATLSWEVDIFGKLLNSKRGAAVAVERSEDYAQAVRSQVVAAVANCYYSMAAVESQLKLSRSTAMLWEKSVQTMRDLKDGGRLTEAAVVQSDANYRSVLAQINTLEVTRHQLDNSMSLLMNVMPQHWEVAADATLEIPDIFMQGVPMQYLAMRPDVNAAERDMASAYYATNSARAAFYPGLTITANGGFTNQLGTMIKNPGEWFYNIAGSLVAPIFSRGQNIARLEAARLNQKIALNAFERTVLNAAAEVSNALTVYEKAGERMSHLDVQVADLEKSVEYTNDLLVYADGTYLEVLTAQQSLLSAQMNRINCALDRSQAIVNLYQATGGGR
ncbi:MAG: TolC family protein [Bacteroidales bacterium]|nr:TolC family protein [Bacteroidales bacterium]